MKGEFIGIALGIISIIAAIWIGYVMRGDSLQWKFEGCDELAFHYANSEVFLYSFSDDSCTMENGETWKWEDGRATKRLPLVFSSSNEYHGVTVYSDSSVIRMNKDKCFQIASSRNDSDYFLCEEKP